MTIKIWTTYLSSALAIALLIPAERLQAQNSPTVRTEPLNYASPTQSDYVRFLRLGQRAMQQGDYAAAVNFFKNAFFERPNDQQALTAFTAARDYLNKTRSARNRTQAEPAYDRHMRIGYNATRQGDYQTALINFRRAIAERPGDPSALEALRTIQTYIGLRQELAQD